MKIILATGIFPPDTGGPAVYTEKLAQTLKQRSIEVIVITYSDKKNSKLKIKNEKLQFPEGKQASYRAGKIQNYDFPVIRISRKYPRGVRHFLYFCRLLRLARDIDLIYAQNLFSAGLPALLASRILGKKMVVKIVGDYVWERLASAKETVDNFQERQHSWEVKFLKKLQTYLAKKAAQIITPSHYLKKLVAGWGVAPEKIEVVYNAVPEFTGLNFSKEEAKRKLGLEGEVLLSVGRLVAWKGFGALIKIMPELLRENPNFTLVIIGEGPESQNLKYPISRYKLKKEVKLLGKIDHQVMPLYFRAADLFVLNSGYEGFSHVILEAMQMAVPIITTRVGGNQELIEDGENGILVDYNNKNQLKEAIIRLSKDKSGQERLIKNSQEKVKEFNWQRLINETLRVFYSTNRELTHKRTNGGHKRRSDLR